MQLAPQFTNDVTGKPVVILSLADWKTMLERLEELEDITAYDAAISEMRQGDPLYTLEQIKAENGL